MNKFPNLSAFAEDFVYKLFQGQPLLMQTTDESKLKFWSSGLLINPFHSDG